MAATVIVVFSSYVLSWLWFQFFLCPCFEIAAGDGVVMMGSCVALPWLRLLKLSSPSVFSVASCVRAPKSHGRW